MILNKSAMLDKKKKIIIYPFYELIDNKIAKVYTTLQNTCPHTHTHTQSSCKHVTIHNTFNNRCPTTMWHQLIFTGILNNLNKHMAWKSSCNVSVAQYNLF